MKNARFVPEFKEGPVKQVIERGYSVSDVAKRLGVSAQSLYKWVKASALSKIRLDSEVTKHLANITMLYAK